MHSIWTEGVSLPHFRKLEGDLRTDVLIIGGGISGILCGHFLKEQNVDYVLLEGEKIGSGTTKNTTAKITSQHGLIYQKLLSRRGEEDAAAYLEANQDALRTYAELCRGMDCDFERKPAYVYTRDNRKQLEKEADALLQIGFPAKLLETTELPFPVEGALCFKNQAQFHPLKFLAHISSDLNIYENSMVRELRQNQAITDRGKVTFQKAIITTHFPIDNKHGLYFLKMYQHRSYVIALKQAAELKGMYIEDKESGLSFRNYKDLLLIGGGGHRTGKTGGNWRTLRHFSEAFYPDAIEAAFWATQDCMSLDAVPYIGTYSPSLPNCYVASGFNKWGMTSSMTAAKILTDLILERANPYRFLFSPSRSIIRPRLFLNGFEAVKGWLTPTPRRCPHLGCALKWNRDEHTWDCSCHGSRFDTRGQILDNPANRGLGER